MDLLRDTDFCTVTYLTQDGEPRIPDANSVSFTVLDHLGAPMVGLVDVPIYLAAAEFLAKISVPASYNTISGSKLFERRTILLTWKVGGLSHTKRLAYRIIPFANYSTTPAQVRSFIGVNETELQDAEIDLFASYLQVRKDFGDVSIDSLLSSGDTSELAANECIKLQAVIDVLPSVKQRIAQSQKNGIIGFERPQVTDLGAVERAAHERYHSAKLEALGLLEAAVTLVLTTTDADPVTGG